MLEYSFMKNAFLASIFISILCPFVGTFLVVRRYSLIGDSLSHASFAGIAIGLVLDHNPIICSFIFTSACGLLIEFLKDYYKKHEELILNIILTLSVGIAITIISSGKTHADVNSFLFGSILTVTSQDLITMAALSIISVIVLILFYNSLLYISFDEDGARISGIKVKLVNYIFAILVSSTISASIRITGILVISSMIAIPVATSLQLNYGFNLTLIFSIIFGFISMMSGLVLSYYINCAPGGAIALVSIFILIMVLLIKKIKASL